MVEFLINTIMKLFLASSVLTNDLIPAFEKLVGKKLSDTSFALIENAADPYPDDKKGFVRDTRRQFQSLGVKLEVVDLLEFENDVAALPDKLSSFDVIWFGGGNVYYLRWLMKKVGFDSLARELLNTGVVYGGGSAGAIVAGQTLKYFDIVDDPQLSPEIIYTGLDLTDFVVLPHWGCEKFQENLEKIKAEYKKDGLNTVAIKDGQAVVVNGDVWKVEP